MQIVIDIPKDVYEEIMVHNREMRESGKSAYYFEGLIQNSTPLDKIRAEIQEELKQDNHSFYKAALEDVLKIIDKYKAEGSDKE